MSSYYEQNQTVTIKGKTFKVTPKEKEEMLRATAPTPKFLVDDKGHLVNRKTNRNDEFQQSSSFAQKPRECGSHGFSFTPVGYNDYSVRPNVILEGVRPGMNNTNPSAFQFLPKAQNNQTMSMSYRGMFPSDKDTYA